MLVHDQKPQAGFTYQFRHAEIHMYNLHLFVIKGLSVIVVLRRGIHRPQRFLQVTAKWAFILSASISYGSLSKGLLDPDHPAQIDHIKECLI